MDMIAVTMSDLPKINQNPIFLNLNALLLAIMLANLGAFGWTFSGKLTV